MTNPLYSPITPSDVPSPSEAIALRARVNSLEAELAERARCSRALTGPDLAAIIERALPGAIENPEILMQEDGDGDLTITLVGVTLDGGDRLVPQVRAYEVEGYLTIPVSFTVNAPNQDEADEAAEEILNDLSLDVTVGDPYHDALDDDEGVRVGHIDYEVRRVEG